MELEQYDQNAPGTGETSSGDEVSSSRGLILSFMKLVGKSTGLARRAGTKTADGIIVTGRRAGKLVKAPSKLYSRTAKKTEKKPRGRLSSEIEQLQRSLRDLHARIGDRLCFLTQADPPLELEDPQLNALVSTVLDREQKIKNLEHRMETEAVEPETGEFEELATAQEQKAESVEEPQVSQTPAEPTAEQDKELPVENEQTDDSSPEPNQGEENGKIA